jgi:hypothetical protein
MTCDVLFSQELVAVFNEHVVRETNTLIKVLSVLNQQFANWAVLDKW